MTTATQTTIPGYTYGQPTVAHSPISAQEFDLLKQTVLWSEEDERYLRMAGDVLADQVEDVLDLWYGFVGSHPHLLHYFTGPDGKPIDIYLSRVRARFGQWILDTCRRPYDQTWLDYQEEIALRHHQHAQKSDRPGERSADRAAALHDRLHLSDHRHHPRVPGEKRTFRRGGGKDASGMVQVDCVAGGAVEPTLRQRGRVLRRNARRSFKNRSPLQLQALPALAG
ncbi:MAG: hypothetical protein KatS3mg048_0704 [Caldilinea sp.]|nr:protoglobin domain-containing protein [Caldilinea sp.]GIV67842.1 MAG: hypothetical protein KatS3mg048_0704 [Caldilinea sp.]